MISKSPNLSLSAAKTLLFALITALMLFAASATAEARVGSPATECQSAFGPGFIGFKIEQNESALNGSYSDPSTGFQVTISNTNTVIHSFSYNSGWPVNVVVKGGPSGGNLYSPPSSSGTGLHPPVNPNNGKYYGISHITFCWNPNTPPPPGKAKLKIDKTAENPVVFENGQVVFTITVRNDGSAPAENTVIKDDVPAGLTVNSADSPCVVNIQQVTCSIGNLPAGQSRTYRIYATADPLPAVTGASDSLDISKVEQQVSVQAGETRTEQLTCGAGGIMTDAAIRVDSVDQGTGDLNSVEVRKIQSISAETYEAEVTNHATGQAQVKFFGVCVGKKTRDGRTLTVSAPLTRTLAVDAGLETLDLSCPAGTTPVAPGYELTGTRGLLLASAPEGTDVRRFSFKIDQDGGSASVSMRCLDNRTTEVGGVSSEFRFEPIKRTVEVPAGAVASEQLTCAVGYKGIVAGWEYPDGVVPLGNDPQPITRVFKVWNSTGLPQQVTFHLLCLSLSTESGGPEPKQFVNTAFVSSSSPQSPGAVLSDSASVTVKPGSPAPVLFRTSFSGASLLFSARNLDSPGSAVVSSMNRVGKSIRSGSVIGRQAIAAGASKAKVRLNPKAIKAIRSGSLKKVRLMVKTREGSSSRIVRVAGG
jgi:uncharacterized repeat protein (TIGR01451 family)